jgi:hypothetical protein
MMQPADQGMRHDATDLSGDRRLRDLKSADFESLRPVSTGWPASNGMGGRIASEWVAGFPRNTQPSPAISRADYSLPLLYSTRRVTWGLDAMRSMEKARIHISGGAASAGPLGARV